MALAAAWAGYAVLVIAVLAIALGQMLYSPTASAFVSDLAAPGRGATYQAALSTTEDIGTAVGPTTGLALGGLGNAHLVWLLGGPLCVGAGLCSLTATRSAASARAR